MTRFVTESETEAFLETETRTLTMPDGKTQPVRQMRLTWNSFDLLIEAGMFTPALLIELSDSLSKRENVSFDEALHNLCAYAHQYAKSW